MMTRRFVAVGLALTLASLALPTAARSQANPNPGVAPPQSRPHGLSYAEWGARWWQWAYSFPADQFPPAQSGAVDCSLGQSGSVWFLAGAVGGGPVTRSCTIPTGKALFFPIVNYLNDYPCPDPDFQPAPGQTLEDFLTEGAEAIIDDVTELQVVVDGQGLERLFDYRADLASLYVHCRSVPRGVRLLRDGHGAIRSHRRLLGHAEPVTARCDTISIHAKSVFADGSSFVVDVTYNLEVAPNGSH